MPEYLREFYGDYIAAHLKVLRPEAVR